MSDIIHREPETISIGTFTFYCEKFRAVCTRYRSEKTTVSGDEVITNSGKRALKLTFYGRMSGDDQPTDLIYEMDALMKSGTAFSVDYKDVVFTDCRVLDFSTEDSGTGIIDASFTLYTYENITRQNSQEE